MRLTSVISSSPRADGFSVGRDVDDLVVVEVQTGHRVRRLRRRRLLLEAHGAAVGVELDDAVALGVADLIAEHGRAGLARRGAAQVVGEVRAVEDVVAERERHAIRADELAADDERLRQAVGARLRGVGDLQPDLAAVAEQAPEAVLLVRRRDHQHLPDAGQHQRRQRVVDHRLVVDRHQLLADGARQRVQPRSRSAGEDDSL